MYTEHFKLRELPFENTPDPRFFFSTDQHDEALAAIEYTVRMRKGFVMITGGVGSGKTTVARTMINRCASHAHVVQLIHGLHTGREVLAQVLHVLDAKGKEHSDTAKLRVAVHNVLNHHAQAGRPVVLIIDEAQTLSDEALEELRLLSNFDTATTKLVQVVLVGQPELRQRVRNLPALRQRVAVAKQIKPLTMEQTYEYIIHRLRAASLDNRTVEVRVTAEALARLHLVSNGAPRMINFICDNCLLLLFGKGDAKRITETVVNQVITDLLPDIELPELQISADHVSTNTFPAPTIVTRPNVADQMAAPRNHTSGARRIDRRPIGVTS